MAVIDEILATGEFHSFQEIAKRLNQVLKLVKYEDALSLEGRYGASFRKDIQAIRETLRNKVFGLPVDMLETVGSRKTLKYRYKEKGFSIMPYLEYRFSAGDEKTLNRALQIIANGLPNETYETVEFWLKSRIEYSFGKEDLRIDYGESLNLRGRHWLPLLYRVIQDKIVIRIQYKTFKGDFFDFQFHPYMLKQYNNRWFLSGRNERENNDYWNVPIDRICGVQKCGDVQFKSRPIDYGKYFDNFIGISEKVWLGEDGDENDKLYWKGVDVASKKVSIVIRVEGKGTWGRIKTKPLHISQTELDNGFNEIENCGRIRLDIIPNVEFYNKIMELGENVIVESPSCVREIVIERLNNTLDKYRNE